jgi:hypothetical protein
MGLALWIPATWKCQQYHRISVPGPIRHCLYVETGNAEANRSLHITLGETNSCTEPPAKPRKGKGPLRLSEAGL